MNSKSDTMDLSQKDQTGLNVWFFLKLFIGTLLLVKAGDGYFTMFDRSNYTPEGQVLFEVIENTAIVQLAVTTLHFIVGAFLIWNTLVPFFASIAAPIFLFATVFEALYGASLVAQGLVFAGLIASVSLMIHYRGHYKDFFVGE